MNTHIYIHIDMNILYTYKRNINDLLRFVARHDHFHSDLHDHRDEYDEQRDLDHEPDGDLADRCSHAAECKIA